MSETAIKQIQQLESEILLQKKKLAELRLSLPPQEVGNYSFTARDGSGVRLADSFFPPPTSAWRMIQIKR